MPSSESIDSTRVFQKRRLSGKPWRSREPGSRSRKKSASPASKERNPRGTTLTGGPAESLPGGPDFKSGLLTDAGSTTWRLDRGLLAPRGLPVTQVLRQVKRGCCNGPRRAWPGP